MLSGQEPLSLLYSVKIEDVVDDLPKKGLSLRKGTCESHWLLRAIKQQKTPLAQIELLHFLYQCLKITMSICSKYDSQK